MDFAQNGGLDRGGDVIMNNNSSARRVKKSRSRAALAERDAQIAALQKQVTALTNQLAGKSNKRRHHPLEPTVVQIQDTSVSALPGSSFGNLHSNHHGGSGNRRNVLTQHRERIGRNASFTTRSVLRNLPDSTLQSPHPLAQRIVEMFKDPTAHMDYLNSQQFAKDLIKLNHKVKAILEKEPRVAFLQSPAYIFGDIHGNLEDLHFFSDNLWRLGMSLTAGNFIFLGDYVDRGLSCLECVAYLLAMKLLLPHKVFLLRGNHETRDVNGWEEHYGDRSFMFQCRARFGDDLGYRIWEQTNQVFDRLPLAAVVDQDIFCVHGGIPRPIGAGETRIQDILQVPKVAGINPPYEHEHDAYQQVASDCIWSDPASEEQEMTSVDPDTGFGESLRGGGAICFGNKAVTQFLSQQGYSYIMRAHEAHAEGVAISKGARVFTVFSTSKDHNQGSQAMAGCILVDFDKLQVINRSPAYRNQYVHRRDSLSLKSLSESEIQKRMHLGLVTTNPHADEDEDDEEEWYDFQDDSEDESNDNEEEEVNVQETYRLSTNRRSSIDLMNMHNNHDSFSESQRMETGSSKFLQFSASSMDSLPEANAVPPTSTSNDGADLIVDFDSNARRNKRSRKPFASINEGCEDGLSSDDNMDDKDDNDDDDSDSGKNKSKAENSREGAIEYDTSNA